MGYIDFFKPDRKETVYVSIINYGLNSKIHCLVLRLVKFSILNEKLGFIWNYILCSIIIPCFQPFVSYFDFVYQMNQFEYIDNSMGSKHFFKWDGKQEVCVWNYYLHWLNLCLVKFFILKALSQQLKEIGNVIFYCIYIPCFQPYFSKFNFVYQMNHFEDIGKLYGKHRFL